MGKAVGIEEVIGRFLAVNICDHDGICIDQVSSVPLCARRDRLHAGDLEARGAAGGQKPGSDPGLAHTRVGPCNEEGVEFSVAARLRGGFHGTMLRRTLSAGAGAPRRWEWPSRGLRKNRPSYRVSPGRRK